MNKFLRMLGDNRIAQILLTPLAIYNLYVSRQYVNKELEILLETINDNDEFFTAIATMGFVPAKSKKLGLETTMEVDKIFNVQDIQNIANETIIKTITEFVRDESLLGIVIVKCDFLESNTKVRIAIQPAHLQMYQNDKHDIFQSIKIWFVICLVIASFFGSIKLWNLIGNLIKN